MPSKIGLVQAQVLAGSACGCLGASFCAGFAVGAALT